MAAELHSSVPKIAITASRIDAVVILGTTRYGVVLDPRDPTVDGLSEAVDTLRDLLVKQVKIDLSEHLESDLSMSTRRSLTS